jgi:hypothetical protein
VRRTGSRRKSLPFTKASACLADRAALSLSPRANQSLVTHDIRTARATCQREKEKERRATATTRQAH